MKDYLDAIGYICLFVGIVMMHYSIVASVVNNAKNEIIKAIKESTEREEK